MRIHYILSLGLFILSVSFAYYVFVYLPKRDAVILNKEIEEFQIKEQRIRVQEQNLAVCLGESEEIYQDSWTDFCRANNLGDNCTLPQNLADQVNEYRKQLIDECYRRFPPIRE